MSLNKEKEKFRILQTEENFLKRSPTPARNSENNLENSTPFFFTPNNEQSSTTINNFGLDPLVPYFVQENPEMFANTKNLKDCGTMIKETSSSKNSNITKIQSSGSVDDENIKFNTIYPKNSYENQIPFKTNVRHRISLRNDDSPLKKRVIEDESFNWNRLGPIITDNKEKTKETEQSFSFLFNENTFQSLDNKIFEYHQFSNFQNDQENEDKYLNMGDLEPITSPVKLLENSQEKQGAETFQIVNITPYLSPIRNILKNNDCVITEQENHKENSEYLSNECEDEDEYNYSDLDSDFSEYHSSDEKKRNWKKRKRVLKVQKTGTVIKFNENKFILEETNNFGIISVSVRPCRRKNTIFSTVFPNRLSCDPYRYLIKIVTSQETFPNIYFSLTCSEPMTNYRSLFIYSNGAPEIPKLEYVDLPNEIIQSYDKYGYGVDYEIKGSIPIGEFSESFEHIFDVQFKQKSSKTKRFYKVNVISEKSKKVLFSSSPFVLYVRKSVYEDDFWGEKNYENSALFVSKNSKRRKKRKRGNGKSGRKKKRTKLEK